MPSKKKKYNSRFPPARIKKIMQSDEEVGKVAMVVPVIISKALEMFVQSLLRSSSDITRSRNARTLTPNHIKSSILSEDQFHFLRDIAHTIPDVNPGADGDDDETGSAPVTAGASQSTATYQRKSGADHNRATAHPMSSAGQAAATGFRMRGRPRKRPLESLTQSSRSMTSTVDEPDDEDEEEEDDDEDDDVDDEEDSQSSVALNSNINRDRNNQPLVSNNISSNLNTNNYYSTTSTHSSIPVSTIRSTGAAATSSGVAPSNQQPIGSSLNIYHKTPAIDEDDDYDN